MRSLRQHRETSSAGWTYYGRKRPKVPQNHARASSAPEDSITILLLHSKRASSMLRSSFSAEDTVEEAANAAKEAGLLLRCWLGGWRGRGCRGGLGGRVGWRFRAVLNKRKKKKKK